MDATSVWPTVYSSFRTWRRDGDGPIETLHTRLRERLRRALGRATPPSAASSGSQSVKTTERGTAQKATDHRLRRRPKGEGPHAPSAGRSPGLVLNVLVPAADPHDRDGGRFLLETMRSPPPVAAEQFPRLRHLWVDAGDRGRFVTGVTDTLGWSVEVVTHWWTGGDKVWVFPGQEPPEKPPGFHLLKWRWIVERTFAWLGATTG